MRVAPETESLQLYTLRNSRGMEVRITNYGGIVMALTAPDRQGRFADVVLGFDSVDGYTSAAYRKANPYFGALIGRYGNRLAKGQFTLNGKHYVLATNDEPNHLHGGVAGFDKRLWTVKQLPGTAAALELTWVSRDGEEGYPGTLTVTVVYTLTDHNEFNIDYRAVTDRDTLVNLTSHAYFNLRGHDHDMSVGDILGHELQVAATRFTPVDATLIPTGELAAVQGTPFDFTRPTTIGARIADADDQLRFGGGYDHNFVVDGQPGTLRRAARLREPRSGRVLEVWTTEPGLQFYSGNFLDGTLVGKGGKVYGHRSGLCLETQHFPDSPNQPQFPTTTLKAGATYHTTSSYRFSAE